MGASSSARFLVETHVGRLIEARVFHLESIDDVTAYTAALAELIDALPNGGGGVLCADHRPAQIYPQPVTDRLTQLFQHMNARLDRVAIVTGFAKATLHMQLRRIARAAGNEARQVFQDWKPAIAHLEVALSPVELARARDFLDGFPERG